MNAGGALIRISFVICVTCQAVSVARADSEHQGEHGDYIEYIHQFGALVKKSVWISINYLAADKIFHK